MSGNQRTTKDLESFYICGQCGIEQYYPRSSRPPIPCVDCGWRHKDRKKYDIPSDVKLSLGKYR